MEGFFILMMMVKQIFIYITIGTLLNIYISVHYIECTYLENSYIWKQWCSKTLSLYVISKVISKIRFYRNNDVYRLIKNNYLFPGIINLKINAKIQDIYIFG